MSGFSLGDSINSGAAWIGDAPFVRRVVRNPILTALLIAAIAAVVFIAAYKQELRGTGRKRAGRVGIYLVLLTTLVMFVHNYCTMRMAREAATQSGVREIFTGIQAAASTPGAVPVRPAGFEGVTGGGNEPECGCTGVPDAPAVAHRPDNVATEELVAAI